MAGEEPGMKYQGLLVEITGMAGPVEPQQLDPSWPVKPAVDVNGKIGRAVGWDDFTNKYVVHLFDAIYVAVPEANLKEYTSKASEDGGFDVAWPSHLETYADFAYSVLETVEKKGFCMVQMIAGEESRTEAVRQADTYAKWKVLKKEFLSDYLGQGGSGKTGFLETELPTAANLDMLKTDALSLFDRCMTNLAGVAAPMTIDTLGFQFGDRTKGMLVTPYSSGKEETALKPEPVNDDDVDEGAVEEHISFIQRRKLCMMTFIENGGGTITLLPRPGLAMNEVTLPLATKKMLVFAADKFSYKYEPKGSTSVSLTSWVLEPPPQMQVKTIDGDAKSKADAVGLYAGREFPTGDRIHVMAVNARLPGGGFGPSEYWSMLMEGTDGEIPIPFLRWDVDIYCSKEWEPHVPGKIYAQHGGFCRHNEIYDFDNKFFDITVEEAEFISPGQRIFMEDGYVVLFRGGHTKESLNGKPVGIFIGDTGSDWTMFTPKTFMVDDGEGGTVEAYGMADNALHGGIQSTTCNRLSHILNLTGPNATADTACSSSLVATGASMLFLRDRRMTPDMKHMEMRRTEGVAGGVCVQIGPGSYIGMCGLNMISPVGRCFTFDESGDGYARGEGVGLMYLKGAEGDELTFNQMACILGCAINQDGRSASMTAPNGPSQQTCITASMREAGNEPRDINLAETHGTGTALGDPIEVGALRNVMEPRETALALTSSKSNIGHLEGGAGVVGLLKCILMLVAGTCPPNAHCRQLNPHLNVAGFPGYFDTEGIDSNLNSALTGVSSFGFGGTNGRCDIWGQAKFGPRKSGKVNIQELDEITVLCPFTLGPINHVTGEPMTKPQGDRKKIRANALRDEWAPYDVSSYAYTGGYRYRQNELADVAEAEELPEDVEPYICGSWSGFTEMELMDKQEDGTYLATMILGETRCETFDICFDKQKDTVAYPAVDMAGQKIWIEGPNELGEGKKWAIDGRDMEVPAGTVYQIRFKFNKEKMEVTWEEASKDSAELALTYEHTYYVCGGFSKHKFTPLEGDEGVWKGSFKIGSQGREEFYFSRDKDLKQLVYPAQSKKGGVPCRGPDNCGAGKYFVVKGRPGEEVTVTLKVADAKVAVSATTESKGTTTWTSQEGWDRHTYTVVGSYNTAPIAMTMDPMKPGVFKCKTSVGFDFVDDFRGFAEVFQVCVDQGSKATFYPEDNLAGPAEMVVFGPNDKGEDKRFLARSLIPGAAFEVVLDLTAEDKRQIVTWTWVADKDAITA